MEKNENQRSVAFLERPTVCDGCRNCGVIGAALISHLELLSPDDPARQLSEIHITCEPVGADDEERRVVDKRTIEVGTTRTGHISDIRATRTVVESTRLSGKCPHGTPIRKG